MPSAQTVWLLGLMALLSIGSAEAAVVIVGPSQLDAGTPVFLQVSGLPPANAKDLRSEVFPKSPQVMFVQLFDGAGQPVLFFWASKQQRYAIILDVNIPGAYQLLIHEIAVGVDPGPDPDPDPDPDPNGKYQIVIFAESGSLDNLPTGQREITASLILRQELSAAGHRLLGVFDPEITGPGGLPEWCKPWWAAVQGDPLPRIALASVAGGAVKDFALPADVAALWKLLGNGQKERP